ncbi:hypothetical protein RIF29_25366 [Crotalaria pallida]|uniref:Uncharacterized protein n=1 Tax=Crotalaria pallida TaxID=3830 RepID=A0AAN9EM95_CROPI
MPKKRGRPPKSPNPKTPDPSSSTNVETQKQGLDLLELDEEDLADIDGLSPKQAEKLLRNLDVIRTKLQGKSSEASMKVADNNQKVHNKEAEVITVPGGGCYSRRKQKDSIGEYQRHGETS